MSHDVNFMGFLPAVPGPGGTCWAAFRDGTVIPVHWWAVYGDSPCPGDVPVVLQSSPVCTADGRPFDAQHESDFVGVIVAQTATEAYESAVRSKRIKAPQGESP